MTEESFEFPLTDTIDLHTFLPSETKSIVEEYIKACRKAGLYKVRIIHGKGKSVQKHTVYTVLRVHPDVLEYHDADPGSGGWGATIVSLREGGS